MILKLCRCFVSHVTKLFLNYFSVLFHVTTSETEMKLFQLLKLFQNYFSDIEQVGKYSYELQ